MNNLKSLEKHSKARINSYVSWLLFIYLGINCVNLLTDGSFTWFLYGSTVLVLTILPPIIYRDPEKMVPFEVLLFLAFPFTLKGIELGLVASRTLNYLSAAGVSLLIVSEIERFSSFKTTDWFAIYLVSITTMASAGFWALARWLSDIYLKTSLLGTEKTLMWEFTAAGLAGLVAGILFKSYFKFTNRALK